MPLRLTKGTPGKYRQICLQTPNQKEHPHMIPLLSEISTQKIKDMDALLPDILVVKKSCNLIRREHENNNRRTKNCDAFHFRPLPVKK